MYWGTLAGVCLGGAGGYFLVDRKSAGADKQETQADKPAEPDELLAPVLDKVLQMLPEEERMGETGEALRSCVQVFTDMTTLVQDKKALNRATMLTDVTQNMNLATALVSQCRQDVVRRNEARPEFAQDFVRRAREWLTAMEDRAVFLRAKLSAQ